MERTPLPSPQFAILVGIRFIEPISFSMLLPFVYFMVRDFHVTYDTDKISMYAGLLASSFALAECVSSVPWGMLSDRIGRKPVLMLGLGGTIVSTLMFGVSQSYVWALVSRIMAGLLSGNVGVMKSMAAEMTDQTNRAVGFNYFSMAFGLGFIVGPSMGGFLTDPAKNIPSVFGGISFFERFPYFLPCALTSFLCAVGMVLCYFFMEETLEKLRSPVPTLREVPDLLEIVISKESTPAISCVGQAAWIAMMSHTSLALLSVMIEELFPFWASTQPEKGGLGFDPKRTGSVFAASGIALVLVQLLAYPFLQRRLGTMFLYKWVFIVYAPLIFCMPYAGKLPYPFPVMIVLFCIRACLGTIAFTSYDILLPDTCPAGILGKVNGISHSLGSLSRAVGPSLCGFLYSWSLGNGFPFPP
ncbi:hypothetical protein DSO57_1000574 [Entomophthora muscae]|uniref:Uncharacterized protein n=1 Tax=Entomophthora muscae TaxID=34485 RepID=A0ACC2SBA8_9FUNG|nr:hypothetical protein DSO57_1000574 [Entomophthora muscae]